MFNLVLSFFDKVFGPKVLCIAHNNLPDDIDLTQITKLMDLDNNSYFVHNLNNMKTINFLFEIQNYNSRGNCEIFMISLLSTEILLEDTMAHKILSGFVNGFRKIKYFESEFEMHDPKSPILMKIDEYCTEYFEILQPSLKLIVKANRQKQSLSKFPGENPYPVLRVSHTYELIFSNDASFPILGTWNIILGDKVPDTIKLLIDMAVKNGNPQNFQISNKDQIFSMVIAPVKDEKYVNFYGLEVTDLIETQKLLILADARWRSLVENTLKFIIIVNKDYKILRINHPLQGLKLEKVVGKPLYDFMLPEYKEIINDGIDFVFNTQENTSFVSAAQGTDNSIEWYNCELSPIILYDGVDSVTIIAENITENIVREEKLNFSNQIFSQILNESKYPIRIIDKNKSILFVNQRFLDLVGLSEDQVTSKKCHEIFENKECVFGECCLKRVMDRGESVESLYKHKELHSTSEMNNEKDTIISIHEYDMTSYPLFNKDHQVIGIYEIFKKR